MTNFKSLGDFADHLKKIQVRNLPLAFNSMLTMVGEESQTIAQDTVIGRTSPLDAVPPYRGWAPLADSTIEQKDKKGLGLNGNPASILYATGEMRDSIQFKVTKGTKTMTMGSNLEYAAVQELGSSRVPPRPFLGPSIIMASDKLYPRFEKIFDRVLNGKRAF